jgi:hypothetical protein
MSPPRSRRLAVLPNANAAQGEAYSQFGCNGPGHPLHCLGLEPAAPARCIAGTLQTHPKFCVCYRANNPEGIESISPGLRRSRYPGFMNRKTSATLKELDQCRLPTPLRVGVSSWVTHPG